MISSHDSLTQQYSLKLWEYVRCWWTYSNSEWTKPIFAVIQPVIVRNCFIHLTVGSATCIHVNLQICSPTDLIIIVFIRYCHCKCDHKKRNSWGLFWHIRYSFSQKVWNLDMALKVQQCVVTFELLRSEILQHLTRHTNWPNIITS